jgi:hypothetical protein
MTSKQEIKDLFTAELLNTAEYQIVLQIKQFIKDEIIIPNIQKNIKFNFQSPLTIEQMNNIQLCFYIEFGFNLNDGDITGDYCMIDMKYFLV